MREPLSFIIPTYQNYDQLIQAVQSILNTGAYYPVEVIIINNGSADIQSPTKNVKVIKAPENLGWEGGLKEGLKHTQSKYAVFCNDDIYIPRSSYRNFRDMVRTMEIYPKIGALGPSTNVAMGFQNIWAQPMYHSFSVPFLVGFCMMVRRSALEEAGGIDDMAPGGDDIDLSIRLKEAGYDLVCDKDAFVYHHGFQTGVKVHGSPDQPMGWNSIAMTERTNDWLIRKHGFHKWWQTMVGIKIQQPNDEDSDIEGEMIKKYIKSGEIVELGCGAKKTVPEAIGVDEVPKGEPIPLVENHLSVADIMADVAEDLPFDNQTIDTIIARHILEHTVDILDVLTKWTKPLKTGGRLIISVPNEEMGETVPINPEHLHAFTPASLQSLGEAVGLKFVAFERHLNGISFVIVFEKI